MAEQRPSFLFSFELLAVGHGYLMAPDQSYTGRAHQNQQSADQQDQHFTVTQWGVRLFFVHLGDDKPVGAGDRSGRGEDRIANVVDAICDPMPKHCADYRGRPLREAIPQIHGRV